MITMTAAFLGEIDRQARSHYDEGAGLALRPLDPAAMPRCCASGSRWTTPVSGRCRPSPKRRCASSTKR
ncbi:hypothetical protein WJ971_20665 [Achromobacter xylosoxidans]